MTCDPRQRHRVPNSVGAEQADNTTNDRSAVYMERPILVLQTRCRHIPDGAGDRRRTQRT